MPGQRPGRLVQSDGDRRPSRSTDGSRSISSPHSLRFAAWSSAAPLAGGPGRSASSLLRLRRRPPTCSVSGAPQFRGSCQCVGSLFSYKSLSQWRSLGARSMLDARSFMISTLRSKVGFAAAVAHARLRLSRLELIGGSGCTAGRYASASRAFISPTTFEQARGGALGAGAGRVGFAGGGLF